MATVSKATYCKELDNICQGDVFKEVKYCYIDAENNETVEIVEFTFPMAIIVSQSCDVNYMSDIITEHSGKATKFMPSVLLCPIYDKDIAKSSQHIDDAFKALSLKKQEESLFSGDEYKVVRKDWHYRYHALSVNIKGETVLDNSIIDFKHYFTVPISYLMDNRKNRVFHLNDLYAEQITLKFATYLSRVAIPD